MGAVPIPREVSDAVVPPLFGTVALEPSFRSKHLSDHAIRMLHTVAGNVVKKKQKSRLNNSQVNRISPTV